MAFGKTYGVSFPFNDSQYGDYLSLTFTSDEEVRSNLIHLLLTRNGTRLYEYIFEPIDAQTFSQIEFEIRETVGEYLPQLTLQNISITAASDGEENKGTYVDSNGEKTFTVPGIAEKEHTAKIKIDYQVTSDSFASSDFVIINI